MELWWRIDGYVRVRLVSADPVRILRVLSGTMKLEQIDWKSDLIIECSVARRDLTNLRKIAERSETKLEVLGTFGAVERIGAWRKYPILIASIAILLGMSVLVPSRILFVQVQGNEALPANQILAAAAECGVYFGASRAELRSENIKNQLLARMPELSWAGVNTSGCVATITVKERSVEPEETERVPGHIVAARDALVTDVTVLSGTALCSQGQAVLAGQVLISGYTDLGLCTRVVAAEGEVYGRTRRDLEAVIPMETQIRLDSGEELKKISLVIGKKRINLYSDSGILHTSCGKMTQVKKLRLPGGWELPVSLVIETYQLGTLTHAERTDAQSCLADAAKRHTLQAMVAGEILLEETRVEAGEEVCRLTGYYECRELIGKRSSGVFVEGDTHDGENGERGAG